MEPSQALVLFAVISGILGLSVLVSLMAVLAARYDSQFIYKPASLQWSPKDVRDWVLDLGPWAEGYADRFFEKEISGHVLLSAITDDYLAENFNMTDLHRKALLMSIENVRELGTKPPTNLWEYIKYADEKKREEDAAKQKEREEKKRELEIAREQLQTKLEEMAYLKEKIFNNSFVDEMLNRQKVSGTCEMTSGTVFPFEVYDANDPVNTFSQAEWKLDLTNMPWNLHADCEYLRKAMGGLGTDEDAIICVITSRSNDQRQQLKKQYKIQYGRVLVEDLRSELSGNFLESVIALFAKPALYDAQAVKDAIYGLGTDESTLIEVLLTRTNGQIRELLAVYPEIVGEIVDDTSGDFQHLLISAVKGIRGELTRKQLYGAAEETCCHGKETEMFKLNFEKVVNVDLCKTDAKILYNAGEARWGTDEDVFSSIFLTKSYYALRMIWEEYMKITQGHIIDAIDTETSGDFREGLKAIVMNAYSTPKFFAMKLKEAMEGLGTDDQTLIRIIVSRSEIDLVQIKERFLELTQQPLWLWIENDTSGDYKNLLLAIVGKN